MAKKTALQGKDLMVWFVHQFKEGLGDDYYNGNGVISLSTECSINLQPVTTEADTKDADVNDLDIDKFNWTVQNTSQIVADDAEIAYLKVMMENKTPVNVVVGIPSQDTDNGADYQDQSMTNGYIVNSKKAKFTGTALITSINENGNVGGKATAVIQLQGITSLVPAIEANIEVGTNEDTSKYFTVPTGGGDMQLFIASNMMDGKTMGVMSMADMDANLINVSCLSATVTKGDDRYYIHFASKPTRSTQYTINVKQVGVTLKSQVITVS